MASKRNLKKSIKFICGDVAGECLFSEGALGADSDKTAQIVIDLAELQENSIEKVSFSFDKTPKDFETLKEYHKAKRVYFKMAFNSLKGQFNESLQNIVKEMNATRKKS